MTDWKQTWRADAVSPLEGRRGDGSRAGQIGVADFPAGTYPACSVHGAMNRVSRDNPLFRCLVEGCNVGAVWMER